MSARATAMSPPFAARVVERFSVTGPSRPERVVHSLDGLEAAVAPQSLADTGRELWQTVQDQISDLLGPVDFLLGLDAGGILPTVAMSSASGLPYKIAWKLHLPLPGRIRFCEPHATRTDVFAYGIAHGQRIVLVDDEISTGRTLANLTVALREAGAVPLAAACLVEDTRYDARGGLGRLGMPLVALTRLDTDR